MSTPLRVLIIGNSPDDVLLLARELRRGGYEPVHERVETAEGLRRALEGGPWDVIISDYDMPDFRATEALRILQEHGIDAPFVVVSGPVGEEAAVETMRAGASDYVMKDGLTRLSSAVARELREVETRRSQKEAEARYRSLVEQIPAVTYIQETIGSRNPKAVTYVSPQYEAMFGYPPGKEMLDEKRWLRALHPDDRDRVLAEEDRTDATGEPFEVEYRVIAADGRVAWVRDQAVLVRDEGGHPLFWQGVQLDITEQKRAEDALRESEERYRVVAETASDAIVMIDEESKILFANGAAEGIFGYGQEEMLGRELTMLMPERLRKSHLAALRKYLDTGRKRLDWEAIQLPGLCKSGREVPIEVSFGEFVKEGRRYFTGFIRDISERKRSEEELKESEERFRALADNISQLAWMADERGWIFWYNKRWFDYTGTTLEEMQSWGWRKVHHPEHVDRVVERIQRSWSTGEPWEDTFPLRGGDGTYRWFLSRAQPIRDETGRIVRWFGTNTDVTEQRQAEEDLRRSEERYRTAFETIDEGFCIVEMLFDDAGDPTDYRFLETNPAFEGMTGLERAEGKTARDLVPDLEEWWFETYGRVALTGEPVRFENRAEAMHRWFDVHASRAGGPQSSKVAILFKNITERKLAEQRVREAREAERVRIAQDIHDGTLQSLIYALQEIQLLQITSGEEGVWDGRDAVLEDVADALRRSVEGLRSAIFELRLEDTLDQSFTMSLRALVELTRRMSRGRFELSLEVDEGFPRELSRRAGGELLRLLQEALNNARRHSGSRNISVRLWREGETALAEVADDGKGFDAGFSGGGVGMSSMRRRALSLGGELIVQSEPGSGSRVRFEAPVALLLEGQASVPGG